MNKRLFMILGITVATAVSLHAQRNVPDPRGDDGVHAQNENGRGPSVDELVKRAKEALKNFRPELPEALQAEKDAYEEKRKALRDALKSVIADLGRDVTRDQVKAVVEKFRSEHGDDIAAQKEKAEALKDAAKELAKEKVPDAVKDLRDSLDAAKHKRKDSFDEFKKGLGGAKSSEDRRNLLEEFRNDQRELHGQLKEQLKKFRDELRSQANDGDRRVDP